MRRVIAIIGAGMSGRGEQIRVRHPLFYVTHADIGKAGQQVWPGFGRAHRSGGPTALPRPPPANRRLVPEPGCVGLAAVWLLGTRRGRK